MGILTDHYLQSTIRWVAEQKASSPEMWRALNQIAQYFAMIGASTEAQRVWEFAYSGVVAVPDETKEGDSSVTSFCIQHQLPDMSMGRPGYKYVQRPDDMRHRYVIHDEVIRRRLTQERPGPEDLLRGLELARPTSALRISPTELEALPHLYRHLDDSGAARKDIVDVCLLCCDIEYRAKNREKATELLKRSYNNAGILDNGYVYSVLGLPGPANLCFHGALSQISEIPPDERQTMVSTMIDQQSGKARPDVPSKTWTVDRWRELLDDFQQAYVKDNIDYIDPEFVFQRPGATAEDIASAEFRLGMTLPPSYRTFLEATNGYADLGNAFPGEFMSVDKIVRQGDIDEDIDFLIDEVPDPETGVMITRKIASRAIRITEWGDVSILLLSPDMVKDGEWACLDYASWHPGVHVSLSFGDWFERRLRGLRNSYRRLI